MKLLTSVSKKKQVQMIVLAKEGNSGRETAEGIGCNQSAIARISAIFKEIRFTDDLRHQARHCHMNIMFHSTLA